LRGVEAHRGAGGTDGEPELDVRRDQVPQRLRDGTEDFRRVHLLELEQLRAADGLELLREPDGAIGRVEQRRHLFLARGVGGDSYYGAWVPRQTPPRIE